MSGTAEFALVQVEGGELLRSPAEAGFAGVPGAGGILSELTCENAARLRAAEPRLAPRPLGLASSFGFGDRIGLATPGHVRALRRAAIADLAPVLAQQSVRELERTGRTHRQVLDAATWGALRAGWFGGYGADADHLKEIAHVTAAAAVGYTMFTLDPSDHIRPAADLLDARALEQHFAVLPWRELDDTGSALVARHRGPLDLDSVRVEAADDAEVMRAAVKYLPALVHAAALAGHAPALAELELSIDEMARPTTPFEHAFAVRELGRLGVRLTGLAPRFPGAFEKGIEFRGSLPVAFAAMTTHAELAAALGPYKLSLHSGSDKLSLYAALARATVGRFHIKTAGTSYLEALRVAAVAEPDLMLEVWALARTRFEQDRASYAISAILEEAPGEDLAPALLPGLLDDDTARRILHVTFGSVLGDQRLRTALTRALAAGRGEPYAAGLERHFAAHVEAIAA